MNPKQSCNIRWAARLLLVFGGLTVTGTTFAASGGSVIQTSVQANDITVTGVVVGSDGEPVIGASVLTKGTKIGTVTDFDGKFKLSVPKGSVLIISYLGCVTQEVNATETPMRIHLRDDSKSLNELVVVGFATQKKVNLTGQSALLRVRKSLNVRFPMLSLPFKESYRVLTSQIPVPVVSSMQARA